MRPQLIILLGLTFIPILSAQAAAASTEPEYLYRQEFDDGTADGWNLATRSMSKWTFADGALIQESLGEKPAAIYNLGHPSWKDFEVRVRIKFIKLGVDPDRAASFAIKIWDERVECLPGRISIWYKKPGATTSSGVHHHDKEYHVDPNHWYDIRIRYDAAHIAVTIDGEEIVVLTEVPPRPATGKPIAVYFDNLTCALDYFRVVDMEPAAERSAP